MSTRLRAAGDGTAANNRQIMAMTLFILHEIEDAFRRRGDDHYGEAVTQREHALQCADLAAQDSAAPDLILSALLHDIGHLLEAEEFEAKAQAGDGRHEAQGAQFLRPYLPRAIVEPIALHVAAKRYLCVVEPGYLEALSPASRLSLEHQGGPFTQAQARRFERAPGGAAALRLRRYDDQAKVAGRKTPGLDAYLPLLEQAIRASAQEGAS